jgi:molybdopterin molybdotransferase
MYLYTMSNHTNMSNAMLDLAQAFAVVEQVAAASATANIFATEKVDLYSSAAFNRVVAAPQYSKLDLPQFNRSSMDGYAVLAADCAAGVSAYKVVETVVAGEVARQALRPGVSIKVMTGAPVPDSAAVVVPVEMCAGDRDSSDGTIKILQWPRGSNICNCGEDVKRGDLIVDCGTVLDPVVIANLIACGVVDVHVYRQPRVVVVSTGNEIVGDVAALSRGKIMNSNGPMLCGLCRQHGFNVMEHILIADNYELTVTTLQQALVQADMVLFSGGVSVGDCDFVARALGAVGLNIYFNRVAVKPGKPITFAGSVDKQKVVFGLPGNPVSAYLTFLLFVMRFLHLVYRAVRSDSSCNSSDYDRSVIKDVSLPLAVDFKSTQMERVEYVPCRLQADGTVVPLQLHNSAHLLVLLRCDGFMIVPAGVKSIAQGERVPVMFTN